MDIKREDTKWQKVSNQNFWAEIAPTDHLVQIYDSENLFLNTLQGFVVSGINSGDSLIIIATREHLAILEGSLAEVGFDIWGLRKEGRYQDLDAESILAEFMVKGWPDEELFFKTVNRLIAAAQKTGEPRRIRAFGEMVALLWQEGNYAATVHLEHLWHKFCATQTVCLYCAYPKSGFTKNPVESMQNICGIHQKVISGSHDSSGYVHYHEIQKKQ